MYITIRLRPDAVVVFWGGIMGTTETRVAVIGIIVENSDSISELNRILSDHRDHIIGRMGIPYSKKNISCITVVIDADLNEINNLCGSIGRLDGISSKAAFSNV